MSETKCVLACLKYKSSRKIGHILRVEIKVGSVDLVEPPKQIFSGSIDIISTGVIWEVIAERGSSEFLPEQIDFV